MAKTTMSFLFLCSLQCLFFFLGESHTSLAPALYLFGDSVLDAGNNNARNTLAKANYPPYGIDFPRGRVTGRFTNGRTIADFLAKSLGISSPPPIWHKGLRDKHTQGFNYASASAGILPETGIAVGVNLSMKKQVKLFKKTVRKYLPSYYKNPKKLTRHVGKSIYIVLTGANDYANNYLQPQFYNSSRLYNPVQFADLIVTELGVHLQNLYNLGARKFVVSEIGPLGCAPAVINAAKPITRCVEELNALVSIFNIKLAIKINELSFRLRGSTFVVLKTYELTRNVIENPSLYGLKDTRNPCCIVGGNGTGPCIPNETPCQDRNLHLFWDSAHASEAANKLVATKCFNGTGLCTPLNVLQLTQI